MKTVPSSLWGWRQSYLKTNTISFEPSLKEFYHDSFCEEAVLSSSDLQIYHFKLSFRSGYKVICSRIWLVCSGDVPLVRRADTYTEEWVDLCSASNEKLGLGIVHPAVIVLAPSALRQEKLKSECFLMWLALIQYDAIYRGSNTLIRNCTDGLNKRRTPSWW